MDGITSKKDRTLRVLVAAANPSTSQAWAQAVRHESDLILCGAAPADARVLSSLDAPNRPNVLVLEPRGEDNVELVTKIRARSPHTAILIVDDRSTSNEVARLFRAGVRGFVLASDSPAMLATAIRAVAAGGAYLSDDVTNRLLMGTIGVSHVPGDSPLARLSDRELSVFRMLGDGLSVREIAEKLYLSPKTVESHREHIKQKLQLRNSRELLRMAIRESIMAR